MNRFLALEEEDEEHVTTAKFSTDVALMLFDLRFPYPLDTLLRIEVGI